MQLLQGDCFEVMQGLADNSVDLVLTDPPYGLKFMGKKWDCDVPPVHVWYECLRVLKPGGHVLAFAGTRTQHRMACNIEDAGFEIRDMLAWVYGSGFPKSHNGPWGGTALKPALEPITMARKSLVGTVAGNVMQYGTGALNIDACRVGTGDSLARPFGSGGISAAQLNAIPRGTITGQDLTGRWPANLLHDGSEEVLALFPMTGASRAGMRGLQHSGRHGGLADIGGNIKDGTNTMRGHSDSGSAARFFKECRPESIDLFFCRAKYIMDVLGLTTGIELCQENASFAETNTPQTSHVVASVLSDAVIAASRGETLLSELKELSTVETRNELNLLCESLIVAILISESAQLQDQLLDAHIPNGCHVKFVEMKKQTGTMTITISLPKSGGCVDPVILNITQANMVHGEKVYASRLKYCAKSSKRERNQGLDSTRTVKYDIDRQLIGDLPCLKVATVLVQLLRKATFGSGLRWNIGESGESITGRFQSECLSTIKTKTSEITESKILSLLMPSLISESIADANCGMASGGSHAESAAQSSLLTQTSTSESLAELARGVRLVVSPMLSQIKDEENWVAMTNFHATVKPIALMEYLVQLASRPGAVVLDPFMGSGTTGIACRNLGREFIGIEMNEEYMEIAKRRIGIQLAEDLF